MHLFVALFEVQAKAEIKQQEANFFCLHHLWKYFKAQKRGMGFMILDFVSAFYRWRASVDSSSLDLQLALGQFAAESEGAGTGISTSKYESIVLS